MLCPSVHQYLVLLATYVHVTRAVWKFFDPPKVSFKRGDLELDVFRGNESMNVFLRLLYMEKETAILGGRNVAYNISLQDLSEMNKQRIIWNPAGGHLDMCFLKGKSEDECQNYIRVAGKLSDGSLMLCGTNAYRPLCQIYQIRDDEEPVVTKSSIDGRAKCPHDPSHNSTALFSDGHLYSATTADFAGGDPVIYREPLRTEQYDLKQLNEPHFVHSISYDDFILFFFREPAVEHMNCGKAIYSRVSRVCKNDKGGPHAFAKRWTTFLKARLNCSVSGEYPFYFDEIQSSSDLVEGEYNGRSEQLVYAVFNTAINSIGGSAVCAFSMRDIAASFDGPFKYQENLNSNWLPLPNSKVPDPRSGRCVNDSRTLPDTTVNFGKMHSLMDRAVPSFTTDPVFVRISSQYRLSSIAVDPRVRTAHGPTLDVVFIGTDDGKVLKVGCSGIGTNASSSVLLEEMQVTSNNSPVRKLSVVRAHSTTPKLLVVADNSVLSVPLQRCNLRSSCWECVASQDPYCAWDTRSQRCSTVPRYEADINVVGKYLLQNVTSGQHKVCLRPGFTPVLKDGNGLADKESSRSDNNINSNEIPILAACPSCGECQPCANDMSMTQAGGKNIAVIYAADTLGMVVVISVLATLLLGFAAGYLCSRHFRTDEWPNPNSDPYPNVSQRHNPRRNRLNDINSSTSEGGGFLTKCSNNKAAALNVSVGLNMPPKNSNDKNTLAAENAKTLTLQKVKKTYI